MQHVATGRRVTGRHSSRATTVLRAAISTDRIAAIRNRGRSASRAVIVPRGTIARRAVSTKPRFDKPRDDRGEGGRGGDERPRFQRPRDDRPQFDRPRGDRPVRGRSDWQEHPRNEARGDGERPRRDNEDDSKVFAKRPAFGGRGEYRERKPDERRPARAPAVKKPGERIAKIVARAGLCSRPRCRGLDHAGPRCGERPRHQFAGARHHDVTMSSPSTAGRCPRPSGRGCSCFTSRAG